MSDKNEALDSIRPVLQYLLQNRMIEPAEAQIYALHIRGDKEALESFMEKRTEAEIGSILDRVRELIASIPDIEHPKTS